MEPPTDTASLRAQIDNLQAELDTLRARYDTLLEAKNRAAECYKADYKKWRDFKRWLFGDAETGDCVKTSLKGGELVAYTRSSVLGKRKQQFEDFGPNLEHAGEEDYETKGCEQESVRDLKVERPHSPPVAVISRHQRRKSYHGGSSHKVLSALSPGNNKDPFLAPNQDDKSSVLVDNFGTLVRFVETPLDREPFAEMPCKAEPSRSIPLTEPRKGKGRYAQVPYVFCGQSVNKA